MRRDACVPDEGDFPGRREEAQLHVVIGAIRRQHEGGVGVVQLSGERLHFRFAERFRSEHDARRIAGEQLVGENVDLENVDGALGHGMSNLRRAEIGVYQPSRAAGAAGPTSALGRP